MSEPTDDRYERLNFCLPTSVVHGAASVFDLFGSRGRLLTEDGPWDRLNSLSDLFVCIRLRHSIVLPRPISALVSDCSDAKTRYGN